jgi:spore maturation protein SpmB
VLEYIIDLTAPIFLTKIGLPSVVLLVEVMKPASCTLGDSVIVTLAMAVSHNSAFWNFPQSNASNFMSRAVHSNRSVSFLQ